MFELHDRFGVLSFILSCFSLPTSGPDTSFYHIFLQVLELLQCRCYGYVSSPFLPYAYWGYVLMFQLLVFTLYKTIRGKNQIILGLDLCN